MTQDPKKPASYDPFEQAGTRCGYLKNFNNPRFGSDYIVALDYVAPSHVTLAWQVNFKLRYIPDRLVLDTSSFYPYMSHILSQEWQNLEQLTSTATEDFNNELVPCWIRVMTTGFAGQGEQAVQHRVYCEDRQPRWGNITLLASLSDD